MSPWRRWLARHITDRGIDTMAWCFLVGAILFLMTSLGSGPVGR